MVADTAHTLKLGFQTRMRMPAPLRRLRSGLAWLASMPWRWIGPLKWGLLRFLYEAAAYSRIRGEIGVDVYFEGIVDVRGDGRISIGDGSKVGRLVTLETREGGTIEIGKNVTLTRGVLISSVSHIRIGDDTQIGEYASIRDQDHGIRKGVAIRSQPFDSNPVHIGRDVWIGRGACILKGVTIGDGAVVGANSVVTRDVAPGTIVAGAPAREIGKRE